MIFLVLVDSCCRYNLHGIVDAFCCFMFLQNPQKEVMVCLNGSQVVLPCRYKFQKNKSNVTANIIHNYRKSTATGAFHQRRSSLQCVKNECTLTSESHPVHVKATKRENERLLKSNQRLFVTCSEYNRCSRPYSEMLTYRL